MCFGGIENFVLWNVFIVCSPHTTLHSLTLLSSFVASVSTSTHLNTVTTMATSHENSIHHQSSTIDSIHRLPKPKVLLVLSGKRKCGKDFLERLLFERLGEQKVLSFRISAPIKSEYARMHQLDYDELLSASAYKENYRKQMVEWSEAIRSADPHHFLRLAILEAYQKAGTDKAVWILNDARRMTDLAYFEDQTEIDLSHTKVIRIRVECKEEIRITRGWCFTAGIDDQTTECGLDLYQKWDLILENNGNKDQLLTQLEPLFVQIADSNI